MAVKNVLNTLNVEGFVKNGFLDLFLAHAIFFNPVPKMDESKHVRTISNYRYFFGFYREFALK